MAGMRYKLCLIVVWLSFFQLDANLMTKAFYHQGRCVDKLVFYFDHDPQISRQDDTRGVTYNLSDVKVSAQASSALKKIEKLDSKHHLQIFDTQSFKIKIKLSPNFVTKVRAYKFTPISAPHGVVIKIFHLDHNQACAFKMNPKEIILDFGHGGHDTGAKYGEIYEKDIVRAVGLKLAKILTQQGYVVHLTRTGDEFVPLDMRTYFANLYTNASLFISLHANHAHKSEVTGIETHRLDCDLLRNLELGHLVTCYDRYNLDLARAIHTQLMSVAKGYDTVDRKIKRSVSQVLLGVEVPAVLIELGFLSNPQEAQLLNTPAYQWHLAQGISKGVSSYMLAV